MVETWWSFFRPLHPAFYQDFFFVTGCQFTIYDNSRLVDSPWFDEKALRWDIAQIADVLQLVMSELYWQAFLLCCSNLESGMSRVQSVCQFPLHGPGLKEWSWFMLLVFLLQVSCPEEADQILFSNYRARLHRAPMISSSVKVSCWCKGGFLQAIFLSFLWCRGSHVLSRGEMTKIV